MIGQPVYRIIYNDILEAINSGSLRTGDRLPSEMELCNTYKTSRITSKRAMEMLADLGYIVRCPGRGSFVCGNTPSPQASPANSGRTIGFVVPDFSDPFGKKLLCSIEENCTNLGYQMVLKRTRDQIGEEERAIISLSDAAGILILPSHGELYNPEILKLILNKRAVVFVDRKLYGLAAPAVTTNNSEAAETGAKYLQSLGHRNIAFYSGPITHTSTVEDRFRGYLKALTRQKNGYDNSWFCHEISSAWTWPFHSPERVSADMETVIAHLKSHPEITAAFIAEYSMALIVKQAAESLGRNIPGDFSILCFDAPDSLTGMPPFTYLCQDEAAIGAGAVEILHRIISGNTKIPLKDMLIPAKLVPGASTGIREPEKRRRRI